jgi:hypothetical protein
MMRLGRLECSARMTDAVTEKKLDHRSVVLSYFPYASLDITTEVNIRVSGADFQAMPACPRA